MLIVPKAIWRKTHGNDTAIMRRKETKIATLFNSICSFYSRCIVNRRHLLRYFDLGLGLERCVEHFAGKLTLTIVGVDAPSRTFEWSLQ
jgi:hypothetical protein